MAIAIPMLSFRFTALLGDVQMGFTEIDGLKDRTSEPVKYREGDWGQDFEITRPGRTTYSNELTMKRGLVAGQDNLLALLRQMDHGVAPRFETTINLLDENNDPIVTWTFHNCWVKSLDGSQLNSTSNEHFVESLAICYDSVDESRTV